MINLLLIQLQIVKFLDRDEAVAGKWSFVERLHGRLLKYWSSVIGDILSNPAVTSAHCAVHSSAVQWRERKVQIGLSTVQWRSQLKWMTASTERGETGKYCDQPALGYCDQCNQMLSSSSALWLKCQVHLYGRSQALDSCLLRWKMQQI